MTENCDYHEGYEPFPINDKLTLYIKKDINDNLREICKDYWDITINDEYRIKFVCTVKEIQEKHGLHRDTIIKTAKKNSYIFEESLKCCDCNEKLIEKKRNTRAGFYRVELNEANDRLCQSCADLETQLEEKKQEDHKKNQYNEDLKKHMEAIETGMYETLSPLELNYLINLAKIGKSYEVAKIMGISESKRAKFHKEMEKLKLIIFHYETGYHMNPDFNKALCKLNTYSNIKSVFGSKLASDLYKKLKKEHLYVYPEIPLAAFVKREQVEHLFTESWHGNYFLMCRLDFVVTDPEGIPKFGVEFQGSYHENKEQKIKDSFKLEMINEIGLEIQYFNASDLKRY